MKKIALLCLMVLSIAPLAYAGFVDNGDGTVTDTGTGLMWQQATAPGTYTWELALDYCEDLTLAGHSDWRLPNRNELQSLVDYSRYNPAIDTGFFPDTQASYYWSSTTSAGYPYYAWVVSFGNGYVGYYSKDNDYYVRAVRAGQCGSFGLPVPILDQRDYSQRLGTCTWTVANRGCLVTSLTMVMKFFNVRDIEVNRKNPDTGQCAGDLRTGLDPEIVDDWLTCHGAFVNGCEMGHDWQILPPGIKSSSKHYNASFSAQPPGIHPDTYAFIDVALANQRPVIAWIKDPENANFTHFVVIRGRSGDSYYINDPWNGAITTLENGELGNYLNDKAIYSCREMYRDTDYDNIPDAAEHNYGTQGSSGYASEPVNTALGNYTYTHTDLRLPGRGMAFEFSRGYNSLDQYSGPLGYGWIHDYNIALNEYPQAAVVKWGDGHEDVYQKQLDGSFNPALPGMHDTLVRNPDNSTTLTTKDETQYQFNLLGKLTSIEDRNGNTINLSYDGNSDLTTITDTVGRNITLTYDGQHRITQIADPAGRNIGYEYDSNGDLVTVTDAEGGETLYEYDTGHRITKITLPKGNILLQNTYDNESRVVSQTNGRGYTTTFAYDTPEVNQTTITDALSKATIHVHDSTHRLLEIIDPLGNSIQYTYDANSNRTQVIDKNGNVTNYTYDAIGNVTSKTDALGNVTDITYDSNNNPLTRIDPSDNQTTYSYDASGNLTNITDALSHTTAITYNAYGQPATITDARSNVTTNTYDANGNLIQIEDALHNITTFGYDAAGRRTSITDANSHTTTFAYDNNTNLLTVTDPSDNVTSYGYDANNNRISVTDPKGKTTTYAYNENDLLISITDPLNNVISYTYDELDRKETVTDPRGNTTVYSYDDGGNLTNIEDPLNNVTGYSHDASGNMLSLTNAKGETTAYSYDVLNRPTSIADPLGNIAQNTYDSRGRLVESTDAKGNSTTYTYDALGRLTHVRDAAGHEVCYTYDSVGNRTSINDARANLTQYGYNNINRLISKTDPLDNVYSYGYDPVGNRTSLTDANSNTISYAYDDHNRLTTITYPDVSTVSFTFDVNGNRTRMVDANGTTTYQYDSLNRLTNYTDAFGKQVAFGYDAAGNRTSLTYPGSKVVNYTYDGLNRIATVTDWLSGVTTYTYDATGNVSHITNPNNTAVSYAYDNADRLTSLQNKKSDASTIAGYTYTLDQLGNQIKALRTEPLEPALTPGLENYTYDDDNRLTEVNTTAYTYDDNGNMIGSSSGNSYTYDYEDRLVLAEIGGTTTQYTYDGLGNRIARAEGGATTRYVLDEAGPLANVLAETDAAGDVEAYYVYGLGLISRITPDNAATYYHYDNRGTTVALTNASEALTDKYAYDEFGIIANAEGSTPNRFKYVGRFGIMDEGNGLQYMRARYYDAGVGRFLNKDPLMNNVSSQGLNRYAYALNNSIRFIDPAGLSAMEGSFTFNTSGTSDQVHDWMLESSLGIVNNAPALASFTTAGLWEVAWTFLKITIPNLAVGLIKNFLDIKGPSPLMILKLGEATEKVIDTRQQIAPHEVNDFENNVIWMYEEGYTIDDILKDATRTTYLPGLTKEQRKQVVYDILYEYLRKKNH